MNTLTQVAPEAATTTELAIEATALQLDGRRGRVFGPVDVAIEPGTLNLITGRAGSGKTSLLLTLVGRMRPNRGSQLTVLGRRLPARTLGVQRRSAAVGIHGLDDLDEEVTVAATLREREAWLAHWYQIVRTPGDARVAEVCAPVFGDSPAPKAKQLVHELDEADNLLLRIALAMLSSPEILVVDDIDALHDTDSRRRVWEALHGLADAGLTIVVSAATSGELSRLGWAVLPTHIRLPEPPARPRARR
ncbi:ABC transporter family protein [Propionicimonas paludicola]|uniref:ABC transporter family protein n=1 Tax=Propionicimonas paludicola TaxID=185243 RepID=A0A2A9CMI4_9ACTN|nr:ATP-binding cassette domain-containing protein [Propionicimonas paludicola]PFG15613.1 ABC transporter family protein [Propionicimonas paludicola]